MARSWSKSTQAHHLIQGLSENARLSWSELVHVLVHTPCNDGVCSAAFRIHPYMRVVFNHPAADVSRDSHEGLFTRLGFCQLGDARVPQIVKTQLQSCTL
jgi:hypothetical protein